MVALNAVYRHVFGNAYIMDEERTEVAREECHFLIGALSTHFAVAVHGRYRCAVLFTFPAFASCNPLSASRSQ